MEQNDECGKEFRSLLHSVGESGNRLLDLEGRMKQVLAGGGTEELDELIRLLQPDLMHLERAGSRIREIETEKGFQSAAPVPEMEKLSKDLAELQKINRRNLTVLRARLGIVGRLMSLAGAAGGPETYREDGGIQTTRVRD
jgi:flagellar biosynthesis/type III secretory pathway chaperone